LSPNPTLTVMDGGRSLSDEEIERQDVGFWEGMAGACERELTCLHPQHPQRGEYARLASAYWRAAGQPDRLRLASVG